MNNGNKNYESENKSGKTPETAAGQTNAQHTNDPGSFSQRSTHVNRSSDEQGGLHNDRETDKHKRDEANPGDAIQPGTQNSSSVTRDADSGAGSGNLTEENRANRTDKFGPDRNSDTLGI
jgi:hypothetical protein